MKIRNQESGIRNQESEFRIQKFNSALYYLLLLFFFLASCRNEQQPHVTSEDSLKEHLINANKIMVGDESKEIEEFISRHGWKMTSTGTGLRYEIYEQGKGKKAGEKKELTISFSVYLLDGTLCYPADEKPLTIILGQGEQTRGLEEGIMLMREGDKARLVVPAHLAFGLQGDEKKIPGKNALYYDVVLLKVRDTNEK
jgi:FKBP-type peptidyl-prolyl cis-trans isomerase FkpA